MKKTSLERGDILYQLRHGVAEKKIVIEKEGTQLVYSGDLSFERLELEPIRRVDSVVGHSKVFGESFVLGTPDNIEKHEKDIQMRFIRNYEYSKLDKTQLSQIENLLHLFDKKV